MIQPDAAKIVLATPHDAAPPDRGRHVLQPQPRIDQGELQLTVEPKLLSTPQLKKALGKHVLIRGDEGERSPCPGIRKRDIDPDNLPGTPGTADKATPPVSGFPLVSRITRKGLV